MPGEIADSILNNYASIGVFNIQCVGPQGDLWYADALAGDANIVNSLFGEVHVKNMTAGQMLSIGRRVGNQIQEGVDPEFRVTEECGDKINEPDTQPGQIYYERMLYVEASPRGNRSYEEGGDPHVQALWYGTAQRGRVLVFNPADMQGQIIINARNEDPISAATHWLGEVMIGDDPAPSQPPPATTPISLANDSADPTEIPDEYAKLSVFLGSDPADVDGGVVGLAPFALHDEDCRPPNAASLMAAQIRPLKSFLFDPDHGPVRLRFYGPVMTESEQPPIIVTYYGQFGIDPPVDVTANFDIETPAVPSLGRDVLLKSRCDVKYHVGYYTITKADDKGDRLKCQWVDGNPQVRDFGTYYFRFDHCLIADIASLGGALGPDGVLTADDLVAFLAAFLAAFFAGDLAIADIATLGGGKGPDGAITPDDLVLFLNEFFSAECHVLRPCPMGMRAGGGESGNRQSAGEEAAPSAADIEAMAARRAAAAVVLRSALGLNLPDNASPDQMIQAISDYFASRPLPAPGQPATPASRE